MSHSEEASYASGVVLLATREAAGELAFLLDRLLHAHTKRTGTYPPPPPPPPPSSPILRRVPPRGGLLFFRGPFPPKPRGCGGALFPPRSSSPPPPPEDRYLPPPPPTRLSLISTCLTSNSRRHLSVPWPWSGP